MRINTCGLKSGVGIAFVVVAMGASYAAGQIDSLRMVVSGELTTGWPGVKGPALGSFSYDPVHDRIYAAGNVDTNQQLRRIDNVSGPGSQVMQTQIFATAWLQFTKGGDLNRGGGTPTVGGMLLNPKPIGSMPAYSAAWILDGGATLTQGTGNYLPALTSRLYRYNLEQDANSDASDEFTTLMTHAQYQGTWATSNLCNIARQYAWSGDGQSIYFADAGSSFGGLWKVSANGGAPVRLISSSYDPNTEPAVRLANGVDTIYFRGGGSTGNIGGIDSITHDGTTTGERQIVVPAATINEFMENDPGQTATFASMTMDGDGNLYFVNTNTNAKGTTKPGMFRLDPQGRLSKVVSFAERQAAFGAGQLWLMNRPQPRTVTFDNGASRFDVTQILYIESGNGSNATPNAIAGVYAFKPGDFNRDNAVDEADMALFKPALTPKGIMAAADNLKFDLNGNAQVTWRDVKILQGFYPFADGDADMDRIIDLADVDAVRSNFGGSDKTWLSGDFTGDGMVDIVDVRILAGQLHVPIAGGVPTAEDWAALAAAVPEPGLLPWALVAALGLFARGRRSRAVARP